MNLPYRATHPARQMLTSQQHRAANAGLVFDKYFAGWKTDFSGFEGEGTRNPAKNVWVRDMVARHHARRDAEPKPGIEEEMARRQRALVAALGGKSWKATATARFVTGLGLPNPLENGFVWHHTGGFPYLPASGLKGALRSFWTEWIDENDSLSRAASMLLGSYDGEDGTKAGTLVVFDMLPLGFTPLSQEIATPHYGPWYQASGQDIEANAPGDWMDPVPIPFLAIEAGAEFQIALAARAGEQPDWNMIRKGVADTLGWIGLGAKTAVGYGRFELRDVEV